MADDDEWAAFPKVEMPPPGGQSSPSQPGRDEFDTLPMVKPVPQATYRGSILPFTRYSDNTVKFEPIASGAIGSILGFGKSMAESAMKAATLPKRVWTGETQMPALGDPSDPRRAGMTEEAMNFATMLGPNVNPMVRSGDRIIPGVGRTAPDLSRATVPTWQEAKRVGGEQHNAVRDLPAKYDPQYMPTLADKIEQGLVKDGVFPEDAPALFTSINRMRAVPSVDPATGQTVHFEPANLISLRKNIANKFDQKSENKHGVSVALKHIDDFIENTPAAAIVGGPASEAAAAQVGDLYAKARANSAAGFRGETLSGIDYASGLRAASANSGQNIGNTVRSQITSAILNAKKLKGFTPEEIARLEAIPEGSVGNNLLRWTGNALGGGGGAYSGIAGAGGAALGNFLGFGPGASLAVGAAVPALGKALKSAAGKGTVESLREAERETLRRSPLFLEQAATQDLVSGSPWRNALARALVNKAIQPVAPLQITVNPQEGGYR